MEKLNLPFGNLQFWLTSSACVLPLALVGRHIYQLNFFYTNDEMIEMNLSGANGKPHPDKHILGAIIRTVYQADFTIVDYYSSFIHVP